MKTLRFTFPFVLASLASFAGAAPSQLEVSQHNEKRWQLFDQPTFNPYLAQVVEKALTQECMALWKQGNGPAAVTKCKEALNAYPTSVLAHRMLADMFELLARSPAVSKEQRAQLQQFDREHRTSAEAIILSILASGDGKSEQTAYSVITISEEYMVVWYSGLSVKQQSPYTIGDKTFDILEVQDKDGNTSRIFFDVSRLRAKTEK